MIVNKGWIGIVDSGTMNTKTNQRLQGDHTFMFIENRELGSSTQTLHLTWGGLEQWDFSDHLDVKYICRSPKDALAARAADVAMAWRRIIPSDKRNTYDANRAKGVMHDLEQDGALAYDFDALRRSMKWSRRLEAPFSTNKGLTCAAWVVACFQAAALTGPEIDGLARDRAWALLQEERTPKEKAAVRADMPGVRNPYYREYVNVGAKHADAMPEVLALLKGSRTEEDMAFLESLMTRPMVVDARFLHTDGLIRRIRTEGSDWQVYEKNRDF